MSEQRLTELLRDVAEPVAAPTLAGSAWHAGRRRRRRVRLAGMAAASVVTVVAVAAAFAVATRLEPDTPLADGAATDQVPVWPTDAPGVSTGSPQSAAEPGPVDVLSSTPPWRDGPLPRRLSTEGATRLSEDQVTAARALYQPYRFEPMTMTPVFALGTDGRVRELDVVQLDFTSDPEGNRWFPLRSTSLSPDGAVAVFPQRDKVVVVDLRTALVHEHQVRGHLEHVLWMPTSMGRTLLVGTEDDTVLLSLSDDLGSVRSTGDVPVSPWDVAAVSGSDVTVAELRNPRPDAPVSVRTWRPPPLAETELPVLMNPELQIIEWDQRAWRRGTHVARNGYLRTLTSEGEQGMAVVDYGSGGVVRMLRFAGMREKSCCQPVGWLDDATVLLTTDVEGLLSWDLRTGELHRITESFDGVVALPDVNP